MSTIEVTTQAQLGKALKNKQPEDTIVCLGGTWDNPLIIRGSSSVVARGSSSVVAWGSSSVVARDSSSVVARDSSSVVARDSSSVVAWGSSSVVARDSSRVEAWGSSRVEARGSSSVVAWGSSRVEARGSSSVEACDSSSVEARDSSRVEACDSSSVEARDSSSVEAWGSSSVVARDSSRVVAWGSSSVVARDSSRVEARGSSSVVARDSSRVEAWGSSRVEACGSSSVAASKYVAIHKMPDHTKTISGGVIIEVPDPTTLDSPGWCDYYGVKITRGNATLYKAVDDDFSTSYARKANIFYRPSTKAKAPDWQSDNQCGNGLHVSPSPAMARRYNEQATRYVEVKCRVADLVLIGDKAKVPFLTVVGEVDVHGDLVAS